MTSTSADRPTIAALAVAVAGPIGLFLFAALEPNAASRADTIFLATLSGAVLIPIAALLRRVPLVLGCTVLTVCTVVWVVHPGPTRGAVVSFLLVGAVALGAAEEFGKRCSGMHYGGAVALGLAIQFLLNVPDLLTPSLDGIELAKLIVLAVTGALTTAFLTQRWKSFVPLIGVAVVLALGPGWTLPVTLGLLAVAAGELLADATGNRRFGGAVLGGVVVAAGFHEPRLGLLLLLGGLISVAERRLWLLVAILVVASAGALAVPGGGSWSDTLSRMAWLPLLLPTAFQLGLRRPRRLLLSLVLALAGLHLLPLREALVVPLLLLAGVVPDRLEVRRLQVVWSGALLVGTLLLAAYPWLRESPLASFLDRLGLSPNWSSAVTMIGLVMVVAALSGWARRRGHCRERDTCFAGLLLLGVGIVGGLPQPGVRLLGEAVLTLDSKSGSVLLDGLDATPVTGLVVDSYLANSLGLAFGAGVAEIRLAGDGGECGKWVLEAGSHTGEWAARRPEVARRTDVFTPSPWISWLTPGRFMAQRYRAKLHLQVPCTATRLAITRSPDLPEHVVLSIFNLVLRP